MKRSQLIADTACKKQGTGFWTHLLFYININWFVINTSCWVTNASFCSIARIKTTCAELYESVSYISIAPIIKIGSHGFISPLWLKKNTESTYPAYYFPLCLKIICNFWKMRTSIVSAVQLPFAMADQASKWLRVIMIQHIFSRKISTITKMLVFR